MAGMSDNPEALRRLWPIIEKALGGLVFTADKAGEVAADMATVRAALAQQAATPSDAAEDALHFAICHAVSVANQSMDMARSEDGRRIRDILGRALYEYPATSRQAATPAPAEESYIDRCDAAFVRDFCPYKGSPDPHTVWRAAWRSALTAPAGLPLAQEPKYTVNGSAIVNRASGEAIPADEPVFIFRARDKRAIPALNVYAEWCKGSHYAAVRKRIKHFRQFQSRHPERMKEPDTAALKGQPEGQA